MIKNKKYSPFKRDFIRGAGDNITNSGFDWGNAASIGAGVGALGLGVGALSKKGGGKRGELRALKSEFDTMLGNYEGSEFQALDRNALRRENVFEGQENIMEEMQVDTQAADYSKEQFQQQQANIMQGLRGVAGTSGAAGLAQALSGQASKQAQQSQITIGRQLQQNRRLKLQEEARMKQQLLIEESRLSQEDRAVQIANLEGARQFEIDKMTNMMGMSGSKIASINQNIAQKEQNIDEIGSAVGQAGSSMGGTANTTNTDPQQQYQGEFEQAQYTYDPNRTN